MLRERYLELVKSALVNELYVELEAQMLMSVLCSAQNVVLDLDDFLAVRRDKAFLKQLLDAKSNGESILLETADGRVHGVDKDLRNFTEYSLTLVGRKRLDNLQMCIESILENDIPGDFLEAGVWRGGCCILMRAVLAANNCCDRAIWLADSFAGVPVSDADADRKYAMDPSLLPVLAVPVDEVKENFQRFGLLDGQVRFLEGWFEETLPGSNTGPLSLLRVDCDLYKSTMTVLKALYGKVSAGGWVIIDDYGILPPCRAAVDEFRSENRITEPLEPIDDHAVFWRVS